MTQSISITLQPATVEAVADRWVRLEQVLAPEVAQYANLADIGQMLARAQSGLSAWSYVKDGCPITINEDGTVTVALDFYAWPSAFDFSYGLAVSLGALGEPIRVEIEREYDLVVSGGRAELPCVMVRPSVTWISHVFGEGWRPTTRPQINIADGQLLAEGVEFGVARLRGVAQGYLHTTRITLVKQTTEQDQDGNLNTTGYRIENLDCHATATWRNPDGDQGHDRIGLAVPKCVESYLATCDNGESKTGTAIGKPTATRPHVYYNSCTGSVMLVLYK